MPFTFCYVEHQICLTKLNFFNFCSAQLQTEIKLIGCFGCGIKLGLKGYLLKGQKKLFYSRRREMFPSSASVEIEVLPFWLKIVFFSLSYIFLSFV